MTMILGSQKSLREAKRQSQQRNYLLCLMFCGCMRGVCVRGRLTGIEIDTLTNALGLWQNDWAEAELRRNPRRVQIWIWIRTHKQKTNRLSRRHLKYSSRQQERVEMHVQKPKSMPHFAAVRSRSETFVFATLPPVERCSFPFLRMCLLSSLRSFCKLQLDSWTKWVLERFKSFLCEPCSMCFVSLSLCVLFRFATCFALWMSSRRCTQTVINFSQSCSMPITITIIAVQGQICSPFSNSVNRMFSLIKNERSVRTAVSYRKTFPTPLPIAITCVSSCVCACVCVWSMTRATSNVLLDSTFVCTMDLPLPAFRFSHSFSFFFFLVPFFLFLFSLPSFCFSLFVILKTPQNRFELNVRLAQLFVVVYLFVLPVHEAFTFGMSDFYNIYVFI